MLCTLHAFRVLARTRHQTRFDITNIILSVCLMACGSTLSNQAQQGMTSIESHHPAHPAAFRQLQSLLSHISSVTLQNRMNSICTALVDFNQVCLIAPSNLFLNTNVNLFVNQSQPWPKQDSKPRLELYWTIRHLMMCRCRGVFDPVEIEDAMEVADYISRNESDPLKRLRNFAAL